MSAREASGWTSLPARAVCSAAKRFVAAIERERIEMQRAEIVALIERARLERSAAPIGFRSIKVLFPTLDEKSAREQLDAAPTSAWSDAKRHGVREAKIAERLAALASAAMTADPRATVFVTDEAFDACLGETWLASGEEGQRA